MSAINIMESSVARRSIKKLRQTMSHALIAAVLFGVSGCGSSSNDGDAESGSESLIFTPELLALPAQTTTSTIAMKSRLMTSNSASELEAWACVSATGFAFIYLFFEEGVITGFDNSTVGMEVFLDPENMPENLDSQIKFLWFQQSNDSILMESPNDGITVSLNNIRFTDDGEMSAFSSTRGQLYCKLESLERER